MFFINEMYGNLSLIKVLIYYFGEVFKVIIEVFDNVD